MWFMRNALIFLLQLLPFMSGQVFDSTVIILKYEKDSLFHSGLCTGSLLDRGGVVTYKDCFNSSSKLYGAVGISRLSDSFHEIRFFKSSIFFEGWMVLTTGRPFTRQANFESRFKRGQMKKSSCIFDMITHEQFGGKELKNGNLMCGNELEGIFSEYNNEWILRQIYSNLTVCLKRSNKCKDGRLQEKNFAEFKNKGFRKHIKLELSRYPDRFRNRLVKINNDDRLYLGYHMYIYHHMYIRVEKQGKPVDYAIHVRLNKQSMKELETGSRDYNAYRVKRLIASTPSPSNVSKPEMNFQTDTSETLANDTTFSVENAQDSAIKTFSQGLSNDSIVLIRSIKNLNESSADIVTYSKSLTVIPIRTSEYHDQIETSKGKREPSATKITLESPLDHLNKTKNTNDSDHDKVRESDLPILRSVPKEDSTNTTVKLAENYAQGKLSARKEDSTSIVTDTPPQSSVSAVSAGIVLVLKDTSDGGKIRERGIPISRSVTKEGSTTSVTMELENNNVQVNLSAKKEASGEASITTNNPLSSVSGLKTGIVQIDSDGGKVRERGIPISRSVTKEGSTTSVTMELENNNVQGNLSAKKEASGEASITTNNPLSSVSGLKTGIVQIDSDGGKVRERGIPISMSVKKERSTTKITESAENYTKENLSAKKVDFLSITTGNPPQSSLSTLTTGITRIEDSSDKTDADHSKVKERGIPISNEHSPTAETMQIDQMMNPLPILPRKGIKGKNVHESAHKDKQADGDEDDYTNMTGKHLYPESDAEEEEYLNSHRVKVSSVAKSRASFQEFHPALLLPIFIIRLLSAFTSEVF